MIVLWALLGVAIAAVEQHEHMKQDVTDSERNSCAKNIDAT